MPYSLNRKSRWAKLCAGGDWLADIAATRARFPSPERPLRLSLSEAEYSLDGSESIRALHSLDTERGMLESRWGKSGRGAASVGDLLGEQENRDPAMAGRELHFQLQRPHPADRVFASKFFKSSN